MSFELIDTKEQKADIKVVGVGGCGNNAIEYMITNKVSGVDFEVWHYYLKQLLWVGCNGCGLIVPVKAHSKSKRQC